MRTMCGGKLAKKQNNAELMNRLGLGETVDKLTKVEFAGVGMF